MNSEFCLLPPTFCCYFIKAWLNPSCSPSFFHNVNHRWQKQTHQNDTFCLQNHQPFDSQPVRNEWKSPHTSGANNSKLHWLSPDYPLNPLFTLLVSGCSYKTLKMEKQKQKICTLCHFSIQHTQEHWCKNPKSFVFTYIGWGRELMLHVTCCDICCDIYIYVGFV